MFAENNRIKGILDIPICTCEKCVCALFYILLKGELHSFFNNFVKRLKK